MDATESEPARECEEHKAHHQQTTWPKKTHTCNTLVLDALATCFAVLCCAVFCHTRILHGGQVQNRETKRQEQEDIKKERQEQLTNERNDNAELKKETVRREKGTDKENGMEQR